MLTDRSYVAQNDDERQRLKAFVARVTEADMSRPVGQHWTVVVGLVHLAFWDRMWTAKFEEWGRPATAHTGPRRTQT